MGIIRTAPQVTVTLGGVLDAEASYVAGWRHGRGRKPTQASIILPSTKVGDHNYADGLAVNIKRDGVTVFVGETVAEHMQLAGSRNDTVISALDVRHAMGRKRLGQANIGPVSGGGWPGIGTDITFNDDGKPNRSLAVDGTGYYTFSTTSTAKYWTYQQALEFIFYWYVPTAVCTISDVGGFDDDAPEIRANVGTPVDFIERVCGLVGGTWTVKYVGDTPLFWPLINGVAAPATRTVYLDSANSQTAPGPYTVATIDVTKSSQNSFDRVEVHSARKLVETAYYSTEYSGSGALLTKVTSGDQLPADCICYFTVDVTGYAGRNLGSALASGYQPKQWESRLVTRRDSSGYIYANSNLWDGERIPYTDAIWISRDGGSTWDHVSSGIKVDREKMRVYVKRKGRYWSGATDRSSWDLSSATNVGVVMTVATRLEHRTIYGTVSTYLTNERTRKIVRNDIQPTSRYSCILPDITGVDVHAMTTIEPAAVAPYDDHATLMDAIRDNIWASRQAIEQQATFTLPFLPEIGFGDAVTISPLSMGLTGLRVTGLDVQADTFDIRVTATNNLDGV